MTKILIIEDSKNLLEIYNDKFKTSGFITFLAADGEEGLAMALTEHPSIILLDVIMPKMDGLGVMKKLREDPWGEKVPIIILTNNPSDADGTLNAITHHHPAFFLLKTQVTPEELVEKVKEVLSKQSA